MEELYKDSTISHMSKRIMTRMIRSHNNVSKIPYNEFVDKKIVGNDARILYYGEKLHDGKGIFLSTSLSVIEAHSHESNVFNISTALIAMICSLFSGLIFSKKITKDIIYLKKKAKKISKLDFSENIKLMRNDEIGDLSISLDKMSNELSSSINNLKLFVSSASHELRTPIGVMCAHALALIENKDMKEKEREKYYEIILKVGIGMKELTENLLILSKLEASVFKLKKEKINLFGIIKESLENYDILEFKKDVFVNIDIKTENIEIDSRVLKFIFNNLIQNALKYCVFGSEINIYEKEEYLFIENLFEGEIEQTQKDLIRPFSRGKNAEDFKYEGTGLGLSIVAKAFELVKIDYKIEIKDNRFIVKIKLFNI